MMMSPKLKLENTTNFQTKLAIGGAVSGSVWKYICKLVYSTSRAFAVTTIDYSPELPIQPASSGRKLLKVRPPN